MRFPARLFNNKPFYCRTQILMCTYRKLLTLILLMWRIWWVPNNASKWQMEFNSAFKGLIKCWWHSTCLSLSHTDLLQNKTIRRFKSWEWCWWRCKSSGIMPHADCYSSYQRYRVKRGLDCLTVKEALHTSDTAVPIYQLHMAKHPTRPESSFTNACYALGHNTWASNLLYGKGPHPSLLSGSQVKRGQITVMLYLTS